MMSISAGGYLSARLLGPRLGLPIAGLASGFASSTATIGAMGARSVQEPSLAKSAVAGAVLSTVATILQMVAVLAATNESTLYQMRLPLIAAGLTAATTVWSSRYSACARKGCRHLNEDELSA